MKRKTLLLIPFLLFFFADLIASEPTFIYLVRHAEKQKTKDPDLSEVGLKRVAALTSFFEKIHLDGIYATQYKRTQQTVAPMAKARGMQVEVRDAGDSKGFAELARKSPGKTLLVAGHSNTVPVMIAELGGPEFTIEDSEYDGLFLVVLVNGKASLQHFVFKP